ncbi:hypothetical protein GTY44_17460 [Streptomyces sp. SID5914]|nr:hypothetical protein [Streptomyces sp. SID5914]
MPAPPHARTPRPEPIPGAGRPPVAVRVGRTAVHAVRVAVGSGVARAAVVTTVVTAAIHGGRLGRGDDAVAAVEEAVAPAGQRVRVEAVDHVEVLDPAAVAAPGPADVAHTEGLGRGHDGVLVRVAVAVLVAELTDDEIARELVVSPLTAKTHVSRIMAKLGARDRSQVVVMAYEYRMVSPGWLTD